MKNVRKDINTNKFCCEECSKMYEKLSNLTRHIQKHMTYKDYYDKWIKIENEDLCLECGNKTNFSCKKHIYNKFCCEECRNKNSKKLFHSENSKNKIKITRETNIKNNPNYWSERGEKTNNTRKINKEKDPDYQNKITTKIRNTKKERYDDEMYINVDKIRQTVEENKEKDPDYQNKITTKIKNTKKERYDDENYNNMEKTINTNLKRRKVKYALQDCDVIEKSKITKQTHKNQDPEYQNKINQKFIETSLKKWGVRHPMQNEEYLEKYLKAGCKIHPYKDTNLYYQGSYEFDFLEKYYDLYKGEIERGKTFQYILEDNNTHYYFSDFFIPSLNMIIEIKSTGVIKLQGENKVIAKGNSVIQNGYKYNMIINKDYSEFNTLVFNH
jgi:hypothetical protein